MIELNTLIARIQKMILLMTSCQMTMTMMAYLMLLKMQQVLIGEILTPMVEVCSMVRNAHNNSGSSTA